MYTNAALSSFNAIADPNLGLDTLEPAPHSAQSRLVQDSGSSGSHHNPSQGSDAPWSPTFDGLEDIVSLH